MRSFFRWWFAQLAGLLPDVVTRLALRQPKAAILDVVSGTITLYVRARGETCSIAQASADDAGMELIAQALAAEKSSPSLLLLRLPEGGVLSKHLSFPSAARHDLRDLLGFEIDRETPFDHEEIHWSYALRRQDDPTGRIEVDLFIAPRHLVDPLIAMARRAGLNPSGIESASTASTGMMFIPLGGETRKPWFNLERPIGPLAAAAGALVLIAFIAPVFYQEWEIAAADSKIAALETSAREAIALRSSVDAEAKAAGYFASKRQANGNPLAMLAAVTRTLPDNTYLTALTMRDGRLTLSGLSPAAAGLVGLFAHTPGFGEPTFESPVVESGNGDLESFSIAVRLTEAGSR